MGILSFQEIQDALAKEPETAPKPAAKQPKAPEPEPKADEDKK